MDGESLHDDAIGLEDRDPSGVDVEMAASAAEAMPDASGAAVTRPPVLPSASASLRPLTGEDVSVDVRLADGVGDESEDDEDGINIAEKLAATRDANRWKKVHTAWQGRFDAPLRVPGLEELTTMTQEDIEGVFENIIGWLTFVKEDKRQAYFNFKAGLPNVYKPPDTPSPPDDDAGDASPTSSMTDTRPRPTTLDKIFGAFELVEAYLVQQGWYDGRCLVQAVQAEWHTIMPGFLAKYRRVVVRQ
ncbi:unnamed protein product [Vitrella brassicaformis CCMP3155]|uniref:Uncharacterized protein n=2 Tax=Vitrella brassicaformis TaxID=1169539 RepID=A0A0G4FNQ8_VITBC|nr:unnamed protein product [Vitrella brassicaformis CCMP3155]|eukprot:CEM15367.1 unnamed protein product [Vitrella brassicaformis CCMP3155]